jgi:hypothetical protein
MRRALFLLVPLILSGCQSAGTGAFSIAVPVDQERKVAQYYSIHEDCSSMGSAVARIINQPLHGTVSIREGREFPNFPQSNPRSACNKETVPATLVYYRPGPGYVGTDSFDVDAILASGADRPNHINVTVK